MKNDRSIIACIIYVVLGVTLVVFGALGMVDSFWSGMGGALVAVGVVRGINILRYRNNESYRENVEIEKNDERCRFIRNKAWAWAGYLFVMITAIAAVVFKLLGQDLLSVAAGCAVAILMLLYWICYLVLKKKY